MCTISIHRTDTALTVTMNRDEARVRGPEIPPERLGRAHALLGPRDSDRGGMWIAVNDAGVVGCLVNAYFPQGERPEDANGPVPTRGEIVPRLLEHGGLEDIRAAFSGHFDPTPYPSFTLLVCSLEQTIAQTWTGRGLLPALDTEETWTMLVSSSWKTEEVTMWRRGAFAAWREAGCPMRGFLPSFHALQPEGEEAYSPLMDRELSTTRSITQVAIKAGAADAVMRYWPRDILPNGAAEVHSLPLRATAARD